MCRTKWKHCPMKGWPLVDINEVLGESKEIQSILEPTDTEVTLLDEILDEDDLYNGEYPLSCNWNSCILEAKKKIFFEDVFKADVAGRSDNLNVVRSLSLKETLTKLIQDGLAEAYARIDKVSEAVELLHPRVENIEFSVNQLLQWCDGNRGGGDATNFMETPPAEERAEEEREEERAEEEREEERAEEERLEEEIPPPPPSPTMKGKESAPMEVPTPQVADKESAKKEGKTKEKANKAKEPKAKKAKVRPKVKKDTNPPEMRSKREVKVSRFDKSPWN